MNNLLKPKTCARKPCEIYSKIYFKPRIQPHIKSRMSIADVTKKIWELYENKSAEIKEEILQIYEKEKKREGDSDCQSQTEDIEDPECTIIGGEGKEDLLAHHR